jgi:dipeptidyl aminopeptidase/acylaminoacyl peptidase
MRLIAGLLVVLGLGGTAFGQGMTASSGKRPMMFEDLQRMKRVSDPQISASGKWVMFSAVDVDLAANTKTSHLWVVPMGGSREEGVGSSKRGAVPSAGSSGGGERQITFWKDGESGGRFSPDGKKVLFVSADGAANGASQIFLADWDEAAGKIGTPRQLTHVSTEADGAIWSPDSQRILFVSRVYPECSTQDSWLHEDQCNKRRDDEAAKSPVKAMVFDQLLYRHWDHYVGLKRSHVLVVSATDGNAVRDLTPGQDVTDAEVPTFSLGGPLGYAWAPDSKEIAYVTNLDLVPAASTNNDIYTLRLDEPGARPVKISTSPGSDDGPAYSPDGKWIAFRSQARAGYESDRFRLMLFDRSSKETKDLLPKFDRWVDEFVWSPDSKAIYLVSADEGLAPIFRTVLSTGRVEEITYRDYPPLPLHIMRTAGSGEYSDLRVGGDGKTLIASHMTVRSPNEIVALYLDKPEHADITPSQITDPTSRLRQQLMATSPIAMPSPETTAVQQRKLTRLNDALIAELDLNPLEPFQFAGANDTPVEGFLVRPPNFDPSKKYPVKFLIHGGPQGAWGDAWSYRWNPELMAASGYVVVMVNPRGSTGYGQAFIDGVNGEWGGKAYVDLMKGLDAAEAQYPFIDRMRECALGGSYGGFMANWILTHTNRFACIVTHDGMFNPQSAYGTTEELWFNEWEFRAPAGTRVKGLAVNGPAQPWNYSDGPGDADPFRKWSPMLSIKNAKTPTLVIHSQRDYRLDVSEGLQLFTALQRLGVPSRMLYFPDEGHWVLKPQNSKLWYDEVGAWCDRWTKPGSVFLNRAYVPVQAPSVAKAPEVPVVKAKPQEQGAVNTKVPVVPKGAVVQQPEVIAKTPAVPKTVPPPAAPKSAAAAQPTLQPGTSNGSFSIAISAPEDEVQIGSDARVVITLKNVSGHQLLFAHHTGTNNPEFSYRIKVRSADGREVEESAYGRGAHDAKVQEEERRTVDYVQPGGVSVQTAHIGKLVNLKRPGRYVVQVSRKDLVSGATVKSNEITLNVVP